LCDITFYFLLVKKKPRDCPQCPAYNYGAHHADTIPALANQFKFDQTEMISKAFDEAWAQLQRGEVDPAMSSLVRTALAKRIIEMAIAAR
jgi:hypothetical protein